MGFLIPLIAGLAGLIPSIESSGAAQKGANLQDQIAESELRAKQGIADQLLPFFQQYMLSGSPYLSMTQQGAANQNAEQFGNAAGQLRGQMQTSGLGYGPSGTTAAAVGQLGTEAAKQSSQNYLQNLLNNEQMKFQAAQGMQGVGNMFSGIAMPTNQLTQNSIGSSVGALGQALQNLIKPKSNAQPNSAQNFPAPGIPGVGGPPVVGGLSPGSVNA